MITPYYGNLVREQDLVFLVQEVEIYLFVIRELSFYLVLIQSETSSHIFWLSVGKDIAPWQAGIQRLVLGHKKAVELGATVCVNPLSMNQLILGNRGAEV